MGSSYEVPKWAGVAPQGWHLDVMKDGKLAQKLMIDEKSCYLFGRNLGQTDFCIDHASCSRVHAALVYHKHLERFFLVDLGSTHGSHIGSIRMEPHKPTQLPVDSQFHFGASTRLYILREKPKGPEDQVTEDMLPENELELDNLTEYNTAQNRRISMLGISEDLVKPAMVMKRKSVSFHEEEDIINPEDIDPNVGRFRNLVQTSVIPVGSVPKRLRTDHSASSSSSSFSSSIYANLFRNDNLFQTNSSSSRSTPGQTGPGFNSMLQQKLGLQLPNPAPEIEELHQGSKAPEAGHQGPPVSLYDPGDLEAAAAAEARKKKYAKEAWPGRHPPVPSADFY